MELDMGAGYVVFDGIQNPPHLDAAWPGTAPAITP
jgi:hypothetical protein